MKAATAGVEPKRAAAAGTPPIEPGAAPPPDGAVYPIFADPALFDAREEDLPLVGRVAVSRPGALRMLGGHLVIFSDPEKVLDLPRLAAGLSPVIIITDPPYCMECEPSWRARARGADVATLRTAGHRCVGLEQDPTHVDIIVRR